MSAKAQRACLWSGPVLLALFAIGFGALAGFITPPSPEDSPEEITRMFDEDRNRIRVGLIISMVAAALLVPWSAAMFVQLRRVEGRFSPLPYVVMLSGTLFSLEFLYLQMFWQVAAFREDASPEFVRNLNDMAWVPFVGLTSTAVVMAMAIGLSILSDTRPEPLFPRWSGYLGLWVAFMFTPGSLCVFFTDGPFAYNGVLAWYIPVSVFVVWVPMISVLMLRALRRQEREYADLPVPTRNGGPVEIEELALELAEVRRELAALSPTVSQ